MSIQLQVRWPNPSHPLLANPTVKVQVDGADTPATSGQPGLFVFDIPDGSAHVLLQVGFEPVLPIHGAGSVRFSVLQADQAYALDGTTLTPDTTPLHLQSGQVIAQNVHPLIDTVSAGNAVAGLTVAEVRTEFVDVTEVWKRVADPQHWQIFEADAEPDMAFVAIGATASRPALWFATFPIALAPPTPEVGTLVFFRPTLLYSYTNVWDHSHASDGQWALNRYLLTPRDASAPMIHKGQALPRPIESYFYMAQADMPWLRASLQRSISRSGKPIVLLKPWPEYTGQFLDAATAKLPELLRGILRFLRGMGYAGTNHPDLVPGRLGISAVSASGPSTMNALMANRQRVRELYLMDPVRSEQHAPFVIQWARNTPDFRLRMAGAVSWAMLMGIYRSVLGDVTGEAGDLFMSVYPETPDAWKPVAQGGSRWWNYATALQPQHQGNVLMQHQFPIFGGTRFDPAPGGAVLDYTPFFEEWLAGSGF